MGPTLSIPSGAAGRIKLLMQKYANDFRVPSPEQKTFGYQPLSGQSLVHSQKKTGPLLGGNGPFTCFT
jgi:hypothetical protein